MSQLSASGCVLLCSLVAVSTGWCAPAPATARSVRLPHAEQRELAGMVCQERHGAPEDHIDAWREMPAAGKGAAAMRATVSCKPHQTGQKFEIYFAAACQRADHWQCARSEVNLRADINNRSVTIHPNGYNAALAHDLVSRIFAYRTHKGGPAISPDTQQCSLVKGPEKDMLDVICDGHVVRLSYWCPQSSCPRVFSIDGFFVPANAAGL